MSQEISEALAAYPWLKLGLIFGSVGRGEAGTESDLDIAVAGERPLTAEQKSTLIQTLAKTTGRPVDLVDLRTAGGLILREALVGGEFILLRDQCLYAEIMKHMWYEQADWMPLRQRILDERREAWINS